jgi:hypothetical protein
MLYATPHWKATIHIYSLKSFKKSENLLPTQLKKGRILSKTFGWVEKNHQRVGDGLANVQTVSCDLTIHVQHKGFEILQTYSSNKEENIERSKFPYSFKK